MPSILWHLKKLQGQAFLMTVWHLFINVGTLEIIFANKSWNEAVFKRYVDFEGEKVCYPLDRIANRVYIVLGVRLSSRKKDG